MIVDDDIKSDLERIGWKVLEATGKYVAVGMTDVSHHNLSTRNFITKEVQPLEKILGAEITSLSYMSGYIPYVILRWRDWRD